MQGSDGGPAVERAHERCRLEGELLAAVYDELLGFTLAGVEVEKPAGVLSDIAMSANQSDIAMSHLEACRYTEVLA